MFAPKLILVPTDFSGYSDKALQLAVDIARQYGAKIHLLHVDSIIQQCVAGYCLKTDVMEQLERETAASAKAMLKAQVERINDTGIEIVQDMRKGTPYEEILKEQQEKKVDLIVIASHGKTGLLDFLLGSVADKVVKGATCPVMLMRS
jgi:universal stress protein A